MDVLAIREALANQLESFGVLTATGRVPDPDALIVPHAFVSDTNLRLVAMDDSIDMDFEVTVAVAQSDADTQDGWDIISQLCDLNSGNSILDALLSDRTLSGEIHSLTFGEIRGVGGSYNIAGAEYLGFQMTFTAHV